MKNKQLKIFALFLLCMSFTSLYAQESTNASGGKATGGGGSASYSVGQVLYHVQDQSAGSVAQGVQQPYEIQVVTGIDISDIQLDISAYPNPVNDFLILKIENYKLDNLAYNIYDLQGRMVENKNIVTNETSIAMSQLVPATYFVRIMEKEKTIKYFKIIKN